MPFFSILMPSRNRASLLQDSIQTAIGQDFDDYEIVVSDNNSRDNTRQVVEQAMTTCDKIRYIQTGRDLSMCDNFEFALTQAKGEYIIYLSDDDALVPGMLRFVADIIQRPAGTPVEVLVWQRGGYGHADVPDDMNRYFLAFRLRSGKLYEVKSKLLQDALCNFDPTIHFAIPKIVNCMISRRAFERGIAKTGRFFVPPYPDYTTASQLLSLYPTYHLIDTPLYLCGTSTQANSGIFAKRIQKVDEYNSLFGPNEITLDDVPYPMPYVSVSYFLATYLKFQKIYPDTFNSPINYQEYFRAVLKELLYYQHFEDVSQELDQLAVYMREYSGSDELLHRMQQETNSNLYRYRFVYQMRMAIAGSPALSKLASTTMGILGVGRSDARQYKNVKSINAAVQLMAKDVNLKARNGSALEVVELDSPADVPLLA